jgi:hypothetical protein
VDDLWNRLNRDEGAEAITPYSKSSGQTFAKSTSPDDYSSSLAKTNELKQVLPLVGFVLFVLS